MFMRSVDVSGGGSAPARALEIHAPVIARPLPPTGGEEGIFSLAI